MQVSKQNCNTFQFFSYGSNLLTKRISLLDVKVEFVSIARLDNYRLDFIKYSKFWGGPQATIVPTANAHVWGVIWNVDLKDETTLDKQVFSYNFFIDEIMCQEYYRTTFFDSQEGVDIKRYYVKLIQVNTPHMGVFTCRAYIQKVNPLPRGDNDDIPVERWPSRSYKNVIIKGALEHHLPKYYIADLKRLKDNGEVGCFKMVCLLKSFLTNDPCQCSLPVKDAPKISNLRKMKQEEIH